MANPATAQVPSPGGGDSLIEDGVSIGSLEVVEPIVGVVLVEISGTKPRTSVGVGPVEMGAVDGKFSSVIRSGTSQGGVASAGGVAKSPSIVPRTTSGYSKAVETTRTG